MFSALDRAVIIAFKFIPLRLGIDEMFSGGMATLLGWPNLTGVTLALIKKRKSKTPLPRVSQLPLDEKLAVEEDNIVKSIAYAREKLGL